MTMCTLCLSTKHRASKCPTKAFLNADQNTRENTVIFHKIDYAYDISRETERDKPQEFHARARAGK
jgi:hypothetical protein